MANFNTHVFAAAAVASFGATVCTKLLNLPVSTALLLSMGGTIGGVLPDIDLKYSVPSKILFSVFGAIAAVAWMFARLDDFAVLELWVLAITIFLLVRFPVWGLFHQFTVHRGSLHSIVAAFMFAVLTAVVGEHVLHLPSDTSWLLSGFVFVGVLIHLTLDEIYSVDFMGARIKRSFGSALKILDMQRIAASCLIVFVTLVAWLWTPPTDELFALWAQNKPDCLQLLLPDYLIDAAIKATTSR